MGPVKIFLVGVSIGVLGFVTSLSNSQASAFYIVDPETKSATIISHIYIYGSEATPKIANEISTEINTMWNAKRFTLFFQGGRYRVRFDVTTEFVSTQKAWDLFKKNLSPKFNFLRIEKPSPKAAIPNFMLGGNIGILFVYDKNGFHTTAAHEYGHGLGLDHPPIWEKTWTANVPSIMYARGTIVASQFQYNPKAEPGRKGGTIDPIYRQVTYMDWAHLMLANFKVYHSLQRNGKTLYYGNIGMVSQSFY